MILPHPFRSGQLILDADIARGHQNHGSIPAPRKERWSYADEACAFITSMASAEREIAAPARISAATHMTSMISVPVAPLARALLV